MNKSELSEMINDLGNAMTALNWPTVVVNGHTYSTKAIFNKLTSLTLENREQEDED